MIAPTPSAARTTAVRDIERICAQDLDSLALRTQVAARISSAVERDAMCIATIDPETLLLTGAISDGLPADGFAIAAYNEYLVEDVHKFSTLARSRRVVGILSEATGEDPGVSHRFRSVLRTVEARYELRAAFVADGQCWGAITMLRTGGRTDFTRQDADLLQAVSAPIAIALRRAARRPGAGTGVTFDSTGAGVLILGRDDQLLTVNDAARRWLDEFEHTVGGPRLPLAVHAVAESVRARTRAATSPGPGCEKQAHARVRAMSGRWLTLQASSMEASADSATGSGNIAVVIDAAPTSDIAQLLMLAYALTPRERQVLQQIIAGAPSAAIAAQLHVSRHTVQDHLKAIFAKVGVRSRGGLVAHVLGEHYL
ncbi:MAG TPA: helix-turn-helix transcriptional regulator [Pseudonocardiaceae bacterium]